MLDQNAVIASQNKPPRSNMTTIYAAIVSPLLLPLLFGLLSPLWPRQASERAAGDL